MMVSCSGRLEKISQYTEKIYRVVCQRHVECLSASCLFLARWNDLPQAKYTSSAYRRRVSLRNHNYRVYSYLGLATLLVSC